MRERTLGISVHLHGLHLMINKRLQPECVVGYPKYIYTVEEYVSRLDIRINVKEDAIDRRLINV